MQDEGVAGRSNLGKAPLNAIGKIIGHGVSVHLLKNEIAWLAAESEKFFRDRRFAGFAEAEYMNTATASSERGANPDGDPGRGVGSEADLSK